MLRSGFIKFFAALLLVSAATLQFISCQSGVDAPGGRLTDSPNDVAARNRFTPSNGVGSFTPDGEDDPWFSRFQIVVTFVGNHEKIQVFGLAGAVNVAKIGRLVGEGHNIQVRVRAHMPEASEVFVETFYDVNVEDGSFNPARAPSVEAIGNAVEIRLMIDGRETDGRMLVTLGDLNFDGNVDDADMEIFRGCMNSVSGELIKEGCEMADVDDNGRVDINDFTLLQACYQEQAQTLQCETNYLYWFSTKMIVIGVPNQDGRVEVFGLPGAIHVDRMKLVLGEDVNVRVQIKNESLGAEAWYGVSTAGGFNLSREKSLQVNRYDRLKIVVYANGRLVSGFERGADWELSYLVNVAVDGPNFGEQFLLDMDAVGYDLDHDGDVDWHDYALFKSYSNPEALPSALCRAGDKAYSYDGSALRIGFPDKKGRVVVFGLYGAVNIQGLREMSGGANSQIKIAVRNIPLFGGPFSEAIYDVNPDGSFNLTHEKSIQGEGGRPFELAIYIDGNPCWGMFGRVVGLPMDPSIEAPATAIDFAKEYERCRELATSAEYDYLEGIPPVLRQTHIGHKFYDCMGVDFDSDGYFTDADVDIYRNCYSRVDFETNPALCD